ncbi:MAG: DUF4125 family protein [Lachnospiraceae bacterium]|nr:DUF4125 family protein [Lachnospiraceae bacterium]
MEHNAEDTLVREINDAVSRGDDGALLELLNEYVGLLRDRGEAEASLQIAGKILELLDSMGLAGTVSYGTSLLNVATAYRAAGKLQEAEKLYDEVAAVYAETLPEDSMLVASLHNNKSLLFQEEGLYEKAAAELNAALEISEANNAEYEIAVTNANLSNTYVALGDLKKAEEKALEAAEMFKTIEDTDTHYASALYALGMIYNMKGQQDKAVAPLSEALAIMDKEHGRTEYYARIEAELKKAKGSDATDDIKGMDICRAFFEEKFVPVIMEKFPAYKSKIAAGLVGRGSDCYGYDDAESRDHDWGPGFQLYVSEETYAEIGKELEEAYNALPKEFMGFKVAPVVSGHKRRGVSTVEGFYKELLGKYPLAEEDYLTIPDYALSTAVNGCVFTDEEGAFSLERSKLEEGYPESVQFKKLAQYAAEFSQCAQYNFSRMLKRGDELTAKVMLADGIKAAMKLAHIIENKYFPHDKWLFKSLDDLEMGDELKPLLLAATDTASVDRIGQFFAQIMYEMGYISDTDDYLDHHTEELMIKSELCKLTVQQLAKKVVRLEFEAFDKVQNEGGRASCQDDFCTFDIMRESQYLTWTKEMLMQYLYDFEIELKKGHNLITEKYGRMMESTAPTRYAEIKDNFPAISPEKKQIIETIVAIQTGMTEAFYDAHPDLLKQARSIHTSEDTEYNTSNETYLRGEISTYSDKMLELYGRYVAAHAQAGKNITEEIISHTVKL